MPDYSFEYDFEFIHHTAIFSSEEKAILQMLTTVVNYLLF
ncbi:hypothetical protein HMPREF9444_01913 [Succinatimonas hippei YIT 12066]|uniref:Uncharacterized protein n=1 Tax=Succinatimonas hippei (strain DSM 22608 / JCM 16073 / KCTC 15190 / YIT 12066) TaxID=762983 RepID=E8LMC7_SUCHY|nr:hypothetical protein HMPREF9444_01913 [Succinatimonas hippei YIT 12066]